MIKKTNLETIYGKNCFTKAVPVGIFYINLKYFMSQINFKLCRPNFVDLLGGAAT